MEPKIEFVCGDILWGRRRSDAKHPIIYLEKHNTDYFIGAMLTSSHKFNNILMNPTHFEVYNSDGVKNKFQFKNTYLVKAKLFKKMEWQPFENIGKLTTIGIEFVYSQISIKPAKLWEDFLAEG
jgi:hypothetical protein